MTTDPTTQGWKRAFEELDGLWVRDGFVLKDEGQRGFSLWIEPANGTEDVYLGDYETLAEVDERTL
jgi:hypothetical protein